MSNDIIKVMIVVTDSNVGGAGMAAVNLIEYMNKDEFYVDIVVPQGSKMISILRKMNITPFEIPGISDKSMDFKNVIDYVKLFRTIKPDIVHSHASLSARIAAKILGIKVVFTRHWVGVTSVSSFAKFLNNLLCDGGIGVSNAAKMAVVSTGVKEEKTTVIYNGVKPLKILSLEQKTSIKKKLGLDKFGDCKILGIAARLEEVKGHIYLLEAFSKILVEFPNTILLIAGEGSLEVKLKEKVAELFIDKNVVFLGFYSNMEEFMNVIDLHILASLQEAFPLSLLEAMSVKTPCVATNCGGIPEIIFDGETGILAEIENAENLANSICKLLSNEEMLEKVSEKAYTKLNRKFSPEIMAKDTALFYKKVLL